MTHAHLVACPSCARHVRASEPACPFCRHDIREAASAFTPRAGPAERLSRAALYAFGVASVAACGAVASQPAYGASFPEDAHASVPVDAGSHDAGKDSPAIAPPYGIVPFNFDAATDVHSVDATTIGAAMGQPPYGIPPHKDAEPPRDAGTTPD